MKRRTSLKHLFFVYMGIAFGLIVGQMMGQAPVKPGVPTSMLKDESILEIGFRQPPDLRVLTPTGCG